MGRIEAGPTLKHLLRVAPSPEVIDSVVPIADEECVVLLGRIARSAPGLTAAALDGWKASAIRVPERLRRRSGAGSREEARTDLPVQRRCACCVGLHELKGNRAGQWAMTVNARWRPCFSSEGAIPTMWRSLIITDPAKTNHSYD
jgi:hypothetical protein